MTSRAEPLVRLLTQADLAQAWELERQAFNTPAAGYQAFLDLPHGERTHGVFIAGRLAAMSASLPFGQYFGGGRVAMGGLSSVAVSVEDRGAGHASRVVTASLRGMRERGEVISSLYPGTTRLYRELGWELAGAYVLWQLAPAALLALDRPEPGGVRRAQPDELVEIKHFYEQQARGVNGHLDRSSWGWSKLEQHWDDHYVYLALDTQQRIEGYVVYKHGESPPGGGEFPIRVIELVARTAGATAALWWLLGSSGSQVNQITFSGSPEDTLALLLPEQRLRTLAAVRWMLRVVEPEAAVHQRGYAAALELEVPLSLSDAQLPENAGDFVLTVSKGEGRLERGGPGGTRLGIGAFSALYSGWATTGRLAQAGLLEGGSSEDHARLDAAFAGPTPWILEEF